MIFNMKPKRIITTLLFALSTSFLIGWSLMGDPKIDVTCSINGFGSGKCNFTNTGDASGKVCGKVVINRPYDSETISSEKYCSGKVETSSTISIDVHIPGFTDYCILSDCNYSWKD